MQCRCFFPREEENNKKKKTTVNDDKEKQQEIKRNRERVFILYISLLVFRNHNFENGQIMSWHPRLAILVTYITPTHKMLYF